MRTSQKHSLLLMISTMLMMRSMCFRAAFSPSKSRYLNSSHNSDEGPPITSTNSGVNLKGDCSKPEN